MDANSPAIAATKIGGTQTGDLTYTLPNIALTLALKASALLPAAAAAVPAIRSPSDALGDRLLCPLPDDSEELELCDRDGLLLCRFALFLTFAAFLKASLNASLNCLLLPLCLRFCFLRLRSLSERSREELVLALLRLDRLRLRRCLRLVSVSLSDVWLLPLVEGLAGATAPARPKVSFI